MSPVQIYGKEQLFDAERVVDLLQALETFSVASTSAQGSLLPPAGASAAARRAPPLTRCGSAACPSSCWCCDVLLVMPYSCAAYCKLSVLSGA